MPSSHSQQTPPITAKPRGIFLRKKMADFGFGSSSKCSSKNLVCASAKNHSSESVNTAGTDISSNDSSEHSSSALPNVTPVTVTSTAIPTVRTAEKNSNVTTNTNNNVYNKENITIKSASKDGNDNSTSFDSTAQESVLLSGHNGGFCAASRMTNESSCASSTGEASFMASSSSSHRQRIQRQITRTSEMKTSCVKSDLTELKSSLSEMKNLSYNSKFRKSIENMLDGRETVMSEDNANPPSGEPLITYPESPTPNSNTNIVTFPCQNDAISSRKSSITTEESCCTSPSTSTTSELKFEQRRMSSASKTKLITEQFKAEESLRNEIELKRLQSCEGFAYQEQIANTAVQTNLQANNMICEKTLDARHEQRALATGDLTQQQGQNVCSAKVRLQADSFSAEKIQKAAGAQQQRQTITSSVGGSMFNKEKVITHHSTTSSNFSSSKGFSTSVSHMQQFSNNSKDFLSKEIEDALHDSNHNSVANYMAENFDDLNKLVTNANQPDVEKAIRKYTANVQQLVQSLNESKLKKSKTVPNVLYKMSEMMTKAWLIPTHGHELGNSLCNALRDCGGLDLLISNCDSHDDEIKFSSAKLLEQCLTTENRAYVVENGLEKVVKVACTCTKIASLPDHSRVSTGILEHLFKHSEGTCEDVIRLGGLDSVLYECRTKDIETLRHCASALANLSLYGGAENQQAMIKRKVPVWLFPLAFHNDDNIKYYACLAIAVLVANKEIEADVLKSGTLNLVEPFVTSHNPSEFAKSNLSHAHGQSKNWLQRLVPVLSSKREEARNLAAFHFCMEAGIKKSQGNTEVFREIGAIECLKKVASCPNAIASKFAAQALRLMGEDVPHKLIQQVPLWSVEDVKEWIVQIGFFDFCDNFVESRVDGDLLLQLTDENLKNDIGIMNGIRRQRFTRELQNLKKMADYSSRDTDDLNAFLQNIGQEFTVYTYSMLNAGVDKESIKCLTQDQLQIECGIVNSIHRLRILESIKVENSFANTFQQDSEKPLDVFISYRRSNGSQLASLLKVHLQLRNFTVFIDVEKLEAGKFDNNLLQSIKQARNFLLVLTPDALHRCIHDTECKDWVHREIVAALKSQCNIIPITDNFSWPEPELLPEDMRQICTFNGVRWIHEYQDACIDKLERFMKGEGGSRSLGGPESYSGPHGTRLMKSEVSGSTSKSPPTYQRTQSNDSSKTSDDSLKD